MKPPGEKAMTVTELLVIIVILIVLASLGTCGPSHGLRGTQMTQILSNMRQLHTATFTMEMDATATGQTNLGWPGDFGGTFSNWTTQLIQNDYLKATDVSTLLSASGMVLKPGKIPTNNSAAVLVYAVKESSGTNTVFLTTANFTNTPDGGQPLQAKAKPYGTNGFVVLRKSGDGAILKASQVGNTNIIGGFAPLCQ